MAQKGYSQDIYFTKPPSGPPRWLSGNESACIEEDSEDDGLIPGLRNPLDEEMATPSVFLVTKSRMQLTYLQSTFYFGMCKANAYFLIFILLN